MMRKQSACGYFHIISVLQTQILQKIQSATLWGLGYSALEWGFMGTFLFRYVNYFLLEIN